MSSDLSKLAMEVPPEVLAWILACLEKKDLKEVRLVCRKLECSAAPLLFNEIYLSTNPAELEIAQNTLRKFGKSIKTVLLSAVEYTETEWGRFRNDTIDSHSVDYVKLAYTNYCRLRQEQQEMLQTGTYFGHLCYALRTIPNTQRLVLTDFEASSHPPGWGRRRSRLWRVGDCPTDCSIQECARGNLYHLRAMIRPRSLLRAATQVADLVTQGTNPWSLVMMGLAATGSYLLFYAISSSTFNMRKYVYTRLVYPGNLWPEQNSHELWMINRELTGLLRRFSSYGARNRFRGCRMRSSPGLR